MKPIRPRKVGRRAAAGDTAGQRTNACSWAPMWSAARAKALVVGTGKETEFGKVSGGSKLRPPETEFERGVRRFGYFLMEVTLVLVIAIFAINVYLHARCWNPFCFPLALAVGLTPQLLPAIISVNLAHGAKRMAEQKVIVKRLASIENFGSMNVLCSDKTGTLTEGTCGCRPRWMWKATKREGASAMPISMPFTRPGFTNPIDEAIRAHRQFDLTGYQKVDEMPYDFIRKRLSILVAHGRHASADHQGRAAQCAGGLFQRGNGRRSDRRYRRRCGTQSSSTSRSSAGRVSARWASRSEDIGLGRSHAQGR